MKKVICTMIILAMLAVSGIACEAAAVSKDAPESKTTVTTKTEPVPVSVELTTSVPEATTPVAEQKSEPEPRPDPEPTEEPEPEPTEEPEPYVPVVTYGEYRFVIFEGEAPDHYINITKTYFEDRFGSLFAFCGEGGVTQWRIYAERDRFEDDVLAGIETGFLAAKVGSVVIRIYGDPCFAIDPDEEAGFIDVEAEVYGKSTPAENEKEKYTVADTAYGTYDDPVASDKPAKYTYMYPAVDGVIADGALPVVIDKDGNIGYYVPGGDLVILDKGEVTNR